MRFDRIDLLRYGCFTDHVIDLKKPTGDGDFHIIYGPNEAGKSTLRDACLDFLYGIPLKSGYNFLHDYQVMEIGAKITANNTTFQARRNKGNKNTLYAPDGTVMSETTLKSIVGDISREGYEQMYSLDDDSLEKGGESILGSKGDLGALLFSAMSGLSDISGAINQIQEESDGFFKVSGRSYELASLKQELKDITDQLRENDVETTAYVKLRDQAKQAKQKWEQIKSDRDESKSKSRELKSRLDAYPVWREFINIKAQLSDLGNAPDVPEGWNSEIDKLIENEAKATATQKEQQGSVERAEKEIQEIEVDDIILSLAPQVERLKENELEARYITSKDIGRRQDEQLGLHQKINITLKKLGQADDTDIDQLILPSALVGKLRDLIEKRGTIQALEESAGREWEEAQSQTKEAQELYEEVSNIQDMTQLELTLKQAQKAPDQGKIEDAENDIKLATQELDKAAEELSPYEGDIESISTLKKPAYETLSKLIAELKALADEERSINEEKLRLDKELSETEAEINSLINEAKIISDKNAEELRGKQQSAWKAHRGSLDLDALPSASVLQNSADNFAELSAEYERLLSARFTQTSEIAQLRHAQVKKAKTEAGQKCLEDRIDALKKKKSDYDKKSLSILKALLLPDDYPLASLEIWLSRLDKAKEKKVALKNAEQNLTSLQKAHEGAQGSLDKAMQAHGIAIENLTWSDRLEYCEKAVQDWKSQTQTKKDRNDALKKTQHAKAKRQSDFDLATANSKKWQEEWTSCLSSVWIDDQQSSESVKEILKELESLESDAEKERELSGRIKAMQDDQKNYTAEVNKLAKLASEPFNEGDPVETADALRKRVAAAGESQRALAKANKALMDAKERFESSKKEVQDIQDSFNQMQKTIPADSLEDLRKEIRRGLQKSELLIQSNKLETDLKEKLAQDTIEQVLDIMESQIGDAEAFGKIKQEYENLESDLVDIENQVSNNYHDWKTLDSELSAIGADNLPAQLEEQKRTLLLQIEEKSHKFMQLSAGVLLAGEALRSYRETHRSSMMKAASEAFVCMTRGAFKKLDAIPRDNTEVLVGIKADGSSIVADEMSRGTRYQLYLALRIAGHAEFARQGKTLPFFADDILEPFDDDRSRETFSLLHSMSKNGQLVYLTHHQHLCDLAKSVTNGQVVVHELPDRAVAHNKVAA